VRFVGAASPVPGAGGGVEDKKTKGKRICVHHDKRVGWLAGWLAGWLVCGVLNRQQLSRRLDGVKQTLLQRSDTGNHAVGVIIIITATVSQSDRPPDSATTIHPLQLNSTQLS